jgi:hypothetical protein
MLEVIGTGRAPGEVIVIAGLGRTAHWYRNVRSIPVTEVAIDRDRSPPLHRTLDPAEASTVLRDYERRNWWVAPVIRRVLTCSWARTTTAAATRGGG